MSTLQIDKRDSRKVDLLLKARSCSSMAEKKESFDVFLQATLPRPATFCPAFSRNSCNFAVAKTAIRSCAATDRAKPRSFWPVLVEMQQRPNSSLTSAHFVERAQPSRCGSKCFAKQEFALRQLCDPSPGLFIFARLRAALAATSLETAAPTPTWTRSEENSVPSSLRKETHWVGRQSCADRVHTATSPSPTCR